MLEKASVNIFCGRSLRYHLGYAAYPGYLLSIRNRWKGLAKFFPANKFKIFDSVRSAVQPPAGAHL